jgi:general secretion pathway protein J
MSRSIKQATASSRATGGFTLIELVVAMAIFAMLAAAGWKVFDGLMKTRERATLQAERLSNWQMTYGQMLRDMSQVTARPIQTAQGPQAALLSDGQTLSFTRTGRIDPRIGQLDGLERVRYEVQNNELVRLSLSQPDQWDVTPPMRQVMLKDVTDWQVEALNPDSTAIWPSLDLTQNTPTTDGTAVAEGETRLPRGIQVSFKQAGDAMQWRFDLPRNLPKIDAPNAEGNPNNNNNNGSNTGNNNTGNNNTANNDNGSGGSNVD